MLVKLVSMTKPVDEDKSTEQLLAYCARVSSPNQDNPDTEKLLGYCAKNGHWSVFEMADMTVEIQTSRAIAAQILRHRSFSFQEFSQRYSSNIAGVEVYGARRQDTKNRQNSIDDLPENVKQWFINAQSEIAFLALDKYKDALELGIAKEQARFLLPLSTSTKLYMKGSIRSFIHYCQVRCDPSTQLEHREIANGIKSILLNQFPVLSSILGGE